MTPRIARAALVAGALVLAFGAAAAQEWAVDAGAGSTSHASVPGASVGALLGVRYEGTRWLSLSAHVPFDSAGLPWAAAGAGARVASQGPLALGIDVAAQGYGYRDAFSGQAGGSVTGSAMSLVGLGGRAARLEIRSGLLQYSSTFAGQSASRTLHASDARLSVAAGPVRLGGEGRYLRAREGDYPYAGADAELVLGRGSLFADAGRWMSDSMPNPAWGAGARLRVTPGTEAFASFQRESRDPVYWNEPRSGWSIGLTRRLGGARASAPRLAPEVRAVGTTFRLPASAAAEAPSVAGDFTGWTPVPMARHGSSWAVTLPVPAGVHRYAFRGADGEWLVPEGVPGRTDDGFGGVTAVLVVRSASP
ncbi:MAG: glycogen-binding domain-containing protein [Gemmatimonadetes bacterium]|nr:glycogen-binding domain-containing protein [Gemmatimonadota bacterium]